MIAVQMGAQPSDVVDMLGALVADTGNHPLLNHLTEGTKVQLKHMLTSSSSDPDIMMNEKTAITTRVAPSFLRIGHLDLHARRVLGSNPTARAYTDEKKNNSKKLAMEALEKIAKHALFREFQDVDDSSLSLSERVLIMIQESGKRIATLVSNWLRVGFCQGNFNCDNCLVAGRTYWSIVSSQEKATQTYTPTRYDGLRTVRFYGEIRSILEHVGRWRS